VKRWSGIGRRNNVRRRRRSALRDPERTSRTGERAVNEGLGRASGEARRARGMDRPGRRAPHRPGTAVQPLARAWRQRILHLAAWSNGSSAPGSRPRVCPPPPVAPTVKRPAFPGTAAASAALAPARPSAALATRPARL